VGGIAEGELFRTLVVDDDGGTMATVVVSLCSSLPSYSSDCHGYLQYNLARLGWGVGNQRHVGATCDVGLAASFRGRRNVFDYLAVYCRFSPMQTTADVVVST
jgi:hypothetical protein